MKNYEKVVLIALVVVFSTGFFFTARSAFSSYSTFAAAKEYNRAVQVKGVAVDGSLAELGEREFTFVMQDMAGATHIVRHSGNIPPTLFEASYIVAAGRITGSEFVARNLLVKCPTRFMQDGDR